MPTNLDGRRALVTGGASGLGKATCEALSRAGARVMVVDVDENGGRAVADALGGEFFRADVSSLDENRAMVAAAVERLGGLDLLYLNAGLASMIGLDESFDLERYRRLMGVNLDGVVFGTHAALPALEAGGGGAIVATASLAGLTAVPYDPLYAANKHAVVGLARSLGALTARGVRFNAVCPGFAESRIIDPIREGLAQSGLPIIPAEKVAATVLKLFEGDMSGECWYVQAGREPEPFRFRGIPGPREGEEARA
ncbi:MAG TPA: SDR family NAD(P)-dependent oxidoreductase [Solirubrobacteraceae bacterium]|nr:SDR family NAD(P)-dependent oxidoreductase [Solirubrobacteraceae bacterium]